MKIEIFKFSKKEILAVIVIFLLAAFLRLYNLNELPIFADEAIYIRWAQVMRVETTLRFLPLSDGKQPLFMWVVIPFMKVINDPLIAGRVVSAVSGLATLLGVLISSYLLFKSKKVSIIAGMLYALSPYTVFFDRMALVDPMLTMFSIWFFVFSIISINKMRFDMAMLAGFALGGALLTKSPALYLVILLPTTLLVSEMSKKNYKVKLTKTFLLWIVILAIGYAMFNILRLGPNFHLLNARNMDYVYPLTHILGSPLDPFIPHLGAYINYIWLLGPGLIILILLGGTIVGLKTKMKETLLLGLWVVVPLISILVYSKVLTARYLLFVLPYILILTSLWLLSKKKWVYKIGIFLVAIVIVQSLYINSKILSNIEEAPIPIGDRSGYLEEWSAGGGIRDVSQILIQKNQSGETVVVGTEGYFGTLPDGLQVYLNKYPEITVIGVGIDIKEVPHELMASAVSGNDTYLLINSTRLNMDDPESKGLSLVFEYPKPARKEGSGNYEKYGPQETLYLFKLNGTQ